MSFISLKNSKNESKLIRRIIRLSKINSRFCLLISVLSIAFIIIIYQLSHVLYQQPKHLSLHEYMQNLFKDPNQKQLKATKNVNPLSDDYEEFDVEEIDLIWSRDIVELFKEQLELADADDDARNYNCHIGSEFILSALPGPDLECLNDILWQYFSIQALAAQTIQYDASGKKLSLKAFVTNRMKLQLNELFDGLPIDTLTSVPENCYNLKFTKIIGNKMPVVLKDISPETVPLLLDPKAKRWQEIAIQWSSKIKPTLRFKHDLMDEVQQELLVTKTILEVERDNDLNFVGLYIMGEDKLPIEYYQHAMIFHRRTDSLRNIFVIICDAEMMKFCQENFEDQHNMLDDVRLLRKSSDYYDFTLMASCNATIVSNTLGVLHALINGGKTTVRHPGQSDEPDFYVPWLISEQIPNWYAID